MARVGKLANLISNSDVRDWIGESVQERSGKEGAGLVEVTRFNQSSSERHNGLTIYTGGGAIKHTVWIKTERVRSTGQAREMPLDEV